jgi:hypothetical protein
MEPEFVPRGTLPVRRGDGGKEIFPMELPISEGREKRLVGKIKED